MPSIEVLAILLFIIGCCIGSFLNVVIWRLPRGGSLSRPAQSHCPHCNQPIAWYDNIPLLSWLLLRARCRRCGGPISVRYPLIELAGGLVFLGLFVAYAWPIRLGVGDWPGNWPGYVAAVTLASCLLAVSIIDMEHGIIPTAAVWLAGVAAVVLTTIFPGPRHGLTVGTPATAAVGIGGGVGLIVSVILLRLGIIPLSFPEEEEEEEAAPPPATKGRPRGKNKPAPKPTPKPAPTVASPRLEIAKELLFLGPIVIGAWVWAAVADGPAHSAWERWSQNQHVLGLGGSLFGLLVGGGIVWLVRIIGSWVAGREAMGLGDVHLMAAAGAMVGWGPAVLAFFVAPFLGILGAVLQVFRRNKRELPYGPALSVAVMFVWLTYEWWVGKLGPGLEVVFARP